MSIHKCAALAAFALISTATTASAEDASRWFVHAGPAIVAPDEKASMTAGGQPVAGADVSIASRWTVEGELGYYLTRNLAVAVAGGYPPTFTVKAAGSLAGMGTAGKMTGGPAGIFAQYHFNRDGMVQPYVGAGAAFLIVFGTKDGALTNLTASSSAGPAIQAGADVMLNGRWGVYVDVKKAWVSTIAKGNVPAFGNAPARADVAVNPVVGSVGVSYHF